jgi:serine/threonine protein kinase
VKIDPMAATMPASSTWGPLSPGDLVADRYRIEDTLGQGVMGTVYRVEHVHMRKRFALKVLDRAWVGSPEMIARFEREAIAAGSIADPHVAQATDFGRLADGSCFLVLEYVDGRTLRSALERGAFDPRRALFIARSIAAALQAAHTIGIVHRDLKPENIMLVDRTDDPDFVKVLDFGLARFEPTAGARAGLGALTRQGAVMGTVPYMAPEQVMGTPVDSRADLYALGVILFEMLTGECPFRGEPLAVAQQHVASEAPSLPPSILAAAGEPVAEVLKRLLAKTPDGRFATALELGTALDGCLAPLSGPSARSPSERNPGAPRDRARIDRPVVKGGGAPPSKRAWALRSWTPRSWAPRAWSSVFTWPRALGTRVVARTRAWRKRQPLRAARAWRAALRARLSRWRWRRPKAMTAAMTAVSTYAKRLRARIAKLPSSLARIPPWGFLLAVVIVAAALATVLVFALGVVEQPTPVVTPAASASGRAAPAKAGGSSSAIPRATPKPSSSHR